MKSTRLTCIKTLPFPVMKSTRLTCIKTLPFPMMRSSREACSISNLVTECPVVIAQHVVDLRHRELKHRFIVQPILSKQQSNERSIGCERKKVGLKTALSCHSYSMCIVETKLALCKDSRHIIKRENILIVFTISWTNRQYFIKQHRHVSNFGTNINIRITRYTICV